MLRGEHHSEPMPRNPDNDPSRIAAWLLPVVAALLTLGGFVAYAFLTPAVYRTSVVIEVWAADGLAPRLSPLEAARRLWEVVLDREVLEQLASKHAPGGSIEEKAKVARSFEASFEIDSVDARAFMLVLRGADRAQVESDCNWLAEVAAKRAPRALGEPSSAERAAEAERSRRIAALVALLVAHPGLAGQDAQTLPSLVMPMLEVEKTSLEVRLAEQAAAGGGASPADDTASLKQRLEAVKAAIRAGQAAPTQKDKPSGAVMAEWRRLAAQLAAAPSAGSGSVPLKARIVSRAARPTWPIVPDRPRWLLAGLAASVVVGVGIALAKGLRFAPDAERARPSANRAGGDGHGSDALPLIPRPALVPQAAVALAAATTPVQAASALAKQRSSPTASEADRVTPVSSYPAGLASEAAVRAAQEVNAAVPVPVERAPRETSSFPPSQSVRTTHALGSPVPPILAPASRRGGSGAPSEGALATATSYSYVSSSPPERTSSRSQVAQPQSPPPAEPAAAPETRRFDGSSHLIPAPTPSVSKDASVVAARRAPVGWRPDLSLLPESRRSLCDEIYPLAIGNCCVVTVVGAGDAADAKSRLAAELALALAESGHARVLLMEGDFERPTVSRFLRVEMPMSSGLSEQLRARIGWQEARPWSVVECSPSLHVLAEGGERAPELILSRPFEDCVRDVRGYYDFIVIDGPPLANTAACRAVHDVVDGIVFAHVRFGQAEIAEARALFSGKRMSIVPAVS
ncbi:MAG: hypothetical protein QM756_37725 [Polyangiaceae bacterium]